jgi:hypothetical protein
MGTSEGSKRAAATNKKKYGKDYYSKIAGLSTRGWREKGSKPRGFSVLSPEKRREMALKAAAASKEARLKRKNDGAS